MDYSILTGNIGAPFTGNLCSILLIYFFNINTYHIKSYLYFMNEGSFIPSGWIYMGFPQNIAFLILLQNHVYLTAKKGKISAEKMVVYHGFPPQFFSLLFLQITKTWPFVVFIWLTQLVCGLLKLPTMIKLKKFSWNEKIWYKILLYKLFCNGYKDRNWQF